MTHAPTRFGSGFGGTVAGSLVVAVVVSCGYCVRLIRDAHDDYPGSASRTDSGAWDLGDSPRIVVDLPGRWEGDDPAGRGSILVVPSLDARVRAAMNIAVSAPPPRGDDTARQILDHIKTEFHVTGATLRIKLPRTPDQVRWRLVDATMRLAVPAGVNLDLRTGEGSIQVAPRSEESDGLAPPGKKEDSPFVVARSIRVRNESRLKGNGPKVVVRCRAPHSDAGTPTPTQIDIESPGEIQIDADLALVQATARHAEPDRPWKNKISFPGCIHFDGRLAGPANSLQAAHQIDLRLPSDAGLQIDAEGESITSSWRSSSEEKGSESVRWRGAIGTDPPAAVRLRTDNGPILIQRLP